MGYTGMAYTQSLDHTLDPHSIFLIYPDDAMVK